MAASDWVTAGAAAGAFVTSGVVAVATYRLARSTDRLGDLTFETLKVAECQATEALRARADDRAPRVIAILAPTEWPPYAAPPNEAERFEPGHEFVTPRENETLIMFRTHGLLRNEGASTAVVQLSGRSQFAEGLGPFQALTTGANYKLPTTLGGGRYALGPGEAALFRFQDWRPLHDWCSAWEHRAEAPGESKLFLEIIASDQFDDGVVDNLSVEVQAYPVEPVGDDLGRWKVRPLHPGDGTTAVGSTVYPAARRYWRSKRANEEA